MLMPGPDTRVVELRVQGLGRSDPAAAVGGMAAVDVDGDGVGRLVRPADRLMRPAPGPVLLADGHPVPRTIEGYLWDGMRPRGGPALLWALLLPGALTNAAHWTLPGTGGRLDSTLRAVLRICGLLLTALLATQVAVLTLDLVAGQCLAEQALCLPGAWHPPSALLGVVGLLPVAMAALVLHRLGATRLDPTAPAVGATPQDGLGEERHGPALRALHTTTALAAPAWLATGGAAGPSTGLGWLWAVALAELCFCLVAVAVAVAVVARRPPRRSRRWLLIGAGVAALAAAAGLAVPDGRAPLPGSAPTVLALGAASAVGYVVFACLLGLAIHRARPGWGPLPDPQQPWLGGWLALPVLVLGGFLGTGTAATATLVVKGLLGGRGALPAAYQPLLAAWGIAGVALALAAASTAVLVRIGRPAVPLPELDALHPDAGPELRTTWRIAALVRDHLPHLVLLTPAVLVAAAALASGARPPSWLVATGAGVLAAVTLGAAGVGWLVDHRPGAPRRLTLLHDLATGWPRVAHPVGPPPPALKVLPELADRAKRHLADPGTRLVLVGEGYGAVLATLAVRRLLTQLGPADVERVGLVTVGAPLQWAYQRGFPAVVSPPLLTELSRALGTRWRALCRGTDPGGGAVTTWARSRYNDDLLGIGPRQDGSVGLLPPAVEGSHGSWVLGGDHWLTDPQHPPSTGRRWRPGLLRNSDYTSDPEWDVAIAMAAGLVAPGHLGADRTRRNGAAWAGRARW